MDQKICEVHNKPDLCFEQDDFQNLPNILNIDNVKQKEQVQKITEPNKKFDYQLMQQSSYDQFMKCLAIAFNKDGTTMIAGCNKLIMVFEFQDDQLREVQQLEGHKEEVHCLQFMKKSNQFISASSDSNIIIWEQIQNEEWQSSQVLKCHPISCITMNQNEDILISGSDEDNAIKFWQKQNNSWNLNQSINCESHVWGVSLNDQGDKLIVSVYDNLILLIQLQDEKWSIKQKIQVEQFGFRLSFINQDQFVFQPAERQHLLIFNYDPKDEVFKLGQELEYSNKAFYCCQLFPIRYIAQIGLIMVKNDRHVHLIKRSRNGQFSIEQSINFGTEDIFGDITGDGRYIATWDKKSQKIQIRKFEY